VSPNRICNELLWHKQFGRKIISINLLAVSRLARHIVTFINHDRLVDNEWLALM